MEYFAKWRTQFRLVSFFTIFAAQACLVQMMTEYRGFWLGAMVLIYLGILVATWLDEEYFDAVVEHPNDRSYLTYFGHAVAANFIWVWVIVLVCFVLPYRGWNSFRQWVYETKEDISHTLGG